jgi:NADP-dependent 3-hydroxy acid dehydrogenase YdfG
MLCITGIARHSLGEALVARLLRAGTDWRIIGVDRVANPALGSRERFREITLDLDALDDPRGVAAFANTVAGRLSEALEANGRPPVRCLVQSAGVYDAGIFVEHDFPRRRRLLGVNLIGHVEMLHAVMHLNAGLGVDNAITLSHIDVGSFQGLVPRAERALYVLSKGAAIDLAAAMQAGGELHRSLYFAPGPVDTHMLHRNHWVVKARGSAELFDGLWARDAPAYKAAFIDGDAAPLLEAARGRGEDSEETAAAFDRYRTARGEARLSDWGILDVDVCARMLAAMVESPVQFPSGLYVATSRVDVGPRLRFVKFDRLTRLRVVEAEGHDVPWAATDPEAGS